MNILHVVASIEKSHGGMGLAALRLAESICSEDTKVSLLVLKRGVEEFEVNSEKKLEIIPTRTLCKKNRKVTYLGLLLDLLKEKKYSVVHVHGLWSPSLIIISILVMLKGIPIIVSPHGSLEAWAFRHKHLKKLMAWWLYQKWVLRKARLIFASSEQEKIGINNFIPKAKVVVIPNGVDPLNDWTTDTPKKNQILFMSRLHPVKGIDRLIEAWSQVRKKGWNIIIAGPDENNYLREILQQIESLGLDSDFHFPGIVSGADKDKLFKESKLFILPSRSENFGLVVAEALQRGLPVLTTKNTPWQDLVAYRCGWWVENTPESIADCLLEAVNTDDLLLDIMGKNGKLLVSKKYTWASVGEIALEATVNVANTTMNNC